MRPRRAALLAIAAAPALGLLLASRFTADSPKGLFQADLVALVVAVATSAFLVRPERMALVAMLVGVALAAIAHGLIAGFDGAAYFALLALGVSLAAAGLASLGSQIGAPELTAGTLGAAIVWIAMTGLFWADPVAGTLAPEDRFPFRQAVIHLDPATACAYDASNFDRFHDPRVYREVELAASTIEPPSAAPTGIAWSVVGILALAMAGLLPRRDET